METVDGMRMGMIVGISSTIPKKREIIFKKTLVPLHQWRLSSLGGRILWDNRKLSYYNIRDGSTLQMRLLLMGGARGRGQKSTVTDCQELGGYPALTKQSTDKYQTTVEHPGTGEDKPRPSY